MYIDEDKVIKYIAVAIFIGFWCMLIFVLFEHRETQLNKISANGPLIKRQLDLSNKFRVDTSSHNGETILVYYPKDQVLSEPIFSIKTNGEVVYCR